MKTIRSKARHRRLIPEIRRRAGGEGLLLALLVVLPVILILIAVPSARAQTFTVLHEFSGGLDGAEPSADLALDAAGNIYGVALFGGSFNYGSMFQLDAAGKATVLHSFLGGEGLWPLGGLLRDAAGNLYGTTSEGGTPEGGGCAHGCGTVFKRDTAGKHTVLYAFTGGVDGSQPYVTMVQDAAGNLYGTTDYGGNPSCFVGLGCGVIFKLDKTGTQSVLYRFADLSDGKSPEGVIQDGAGNLYTTTYDGGTLGHGAVLKLDTTGKLTVLYSFTGGADSGDPTGPLIRDTTGNLYGATYGVFDNQRDFGAVFRLDTAGNLTVLHSFIGGFEGQYPNSVVLDAKGNLYGVALGGGTGTGCYYGSCGTVFRVDTAGNLTVLHSFTGADGELPRSLIVDGAGNLYGTTLGGGTGKGCTYYHGCGTVFKLTP
jgi:uncharacterized repeat protein (TIGR03803 family)